MSPNPLLGWSRLGLLALIVLIAAVAGLWRASSRPPVVDAGDLAADAGARLGSEVVVVGEWVWSGPTAAGYMQVVLRGRHGGYVECHFEDVPAADRSRVESRVVRPGEVAVRGRYDGVEEGISVLRGCRPLD
jgi:hypothetical protein